MLIEKNTMPLVAMEFMNQVHFEDIDIINRLFELVLNYEQAPSTHNKAKIQEEFGKWYAHTVEHFQNEELQMKQKNFPPYHMHKTEHDQALFRMEDVFNQWQKNDDTTQLKAYFIQELTPWLLKHIQTMDTVTAMFLKTGLSPCSMK